MSTVVVSGFMRVPEAIFEGVNKSIRPETRGTWSSFACTWH